MLRVARCGLDLRFAILRFMIAGGLRVVRCGMCERHGKGEVESFPL